MRTVSLLPALLLALLLVPSLALAQPRINLDMTAEKQVTIVENGQRRTEMVPAEEVVSGEIIRYTIHYRNDGDQAATNVEINNQVPEGTTFIPGSAAGEGAEITFSIDGGKSFKQPSLLTYEVTLPDGQQERRVASPEQYNAVRWEVAAIPPGGSGQVSYQVRVQ